MSDDDSYDAYGDAGPNNVADGGFGQDTSAGDGLPGFPVAEPARTTAIDKASNGLP